MNNKTITTIYIGLLITALAVACKKEMLPEQERLFRPTLKGSLKAEGNYIDASWEYMKGATSYTVQLSRDTFKTIITSRTIDSAHTIFTNLLWEKNYQLQVRANAPDSNKNSRFSYLGDIKTPRFPTILNVPGLTDVNTTQVRVSWQTGGAPVTEIKILLAADSSVVKSVPLTDADRTAAFKLVQGLTPGTPYIIYLYSTTSVRGWADFSTKDPISGNIVDLTSITGRPSVLLDTLPLIAAGSTVLLKKGETYNISSGLSLTKSVTITSGDDLIITKQPLLYFTSNFAFASGSNVDYVRFQNLEMTSDNFGSRYVFNVNAAFNVGEISFSDCYIHTFRGVCRLQNQAIEVTKFMMNNCVVDSIKDYGVVNADGASALIKEISITNSTIYQCEKMIVSTKPTGTMTSVTVENCTLNEAALGGAGTGTGNALIDCSNQKFTGLISFKNNIVGPGWLRDNVIIRGIRPGAGAIEASNNYKTSDANMAVDGPVPDIIAYSGSSTDLFTNPANGNFKIKDNSFAGKNTAGDPRWRP